MSVNVKCIGRLGNNLFQYCIGRIIAESLEMPLNCYPDSTIPAGPKYPNLPPATFLHGLESNFADVSLKTHHVDESLPAEYYEIGNGLDANGNRFDIDRVINNTRPRNIFLKGYFQRFEYYASSYKKISHWLQIDSFRPHTTIHKNDVLLNIRRGIDFSLLNWILPLDYYTTVLDSMKNIGHIYVCGTSISQELIDKLSIYRPIYLNELTPLEQFVYIQAFNRVILSNSTFAWWAAFLSGPEEIYAPHSTSGDIYAFTGYRDVDLGMRRSGYQPISVAYADELIFAVDRSADFLVNISKLGIATVVAEKYFVGAANGSLDMSCLDWLAKQRYLVSYSDIKSNYHGCKLHSFILTLIRSGLLSITNG